MIQWIKRRLGAFTIIAILGILAGGSIAATQAYARENASDSAIQAYTVAESEYIQGTITAVNAAKHTFILLPTGELQTITIFFDQQTTIEVGQKTLAAGTNVSVKTIQRAQGVLYAGEIKAAATNDGPGDTDQGDDKGGGKGQGGPGGHDQEGQDG
jgi:hypothetical protein